MSHKKVSICVPVYNGERYLGECLDSIQAQTFRDFEVLIIDDCSTDKSFELAEVYANRDDRIRLCRNKANLGLVRNWNTCIMRSSGEWIKFVFQDDWLYPTCVERMMDAAMDSPSPLIACDRDFMFENEDDPANRYYRETVKHLPRFYEKKTFVEAREFSNLIVRFLLDKNVGSNFAGEPPNMLINKSVFCDLGFFNPVLIQACDYEFWSRVGSHYGIVVIPERLSRFRIHQASATSRNLAASGKGNEYLEMLAVLHDFCFSEAFYAFRDAIGGEGRTAIRRYAEKLLSRAKTRATEDSAWGQASREFQIFLERYPVLADILERKERKNFRHMTRTVRGYARKWLRQRA